jgi:hypothetical protein
MKKFSLLFLVIFTLFFSSISYASYIEIFPHNFITQYSILHEEQLYQQDTLIVKEKAYIDSDLLYKYDNVERLRIIADQFKQERILYQNGQQLLVNTKGIYSSEFFQAPQYIVTSSLPDQYTVLIFNR